MITRYWPFIVLGFVASGFVMPSLPVWALCFYLLFIPLFMGRVACGALVVPREAFGGGLFVLWALLSITWSPSWHGIADVVCTALFLLGGVLALRDRPDFSYQLKRVCVIGMSLNAGVTLLTLLLGLESRDRPGGVGVLHTTLPAVIIAGICFLWASASFLKNEKASSDTIAALLILPSFMVFSGSRAPCVAVAVAALLLVVTAQKGRSWRLCTLVGGSLFISGVILWRRVASFMQDAVARGDSYHRLIWKTVWGQSWQRPWIGHGQGAPVRVAVDGQLFAHAHNLYLGTFYSYGLVGELLLVLAFGWPMVRCLKRRDWEVMAVFSFIALVVMTDIACPLKGPSEIWYVLWVPWLCLVDCDRTFYGQGGKVRL